MLGVGYVESSYYINLKLTSIWQRQVSIQRNTQKIVQPIDENLRIARLKLDQIFEQIATRQRRFQLNRRAILQMTQRVQLFGQLQLVIVVQLLVDDHQQFLVEFQTLQTRSGAGVSDDQIGRFEIWANARLEPVALDFNGTGDARQFQIHVLTAPNLEHEFFEAERAQKLQHVRIGDRLD